MKNLQKFAVALLVGIMAIGFSAFTSSSNQDTYDFRYYGVADNASGSEYHWQSAQPNDLDCTPLTTTGACIISTNSSTPPADDNLPSVPYAIESGSSRLFK